MKRCLVLVFMLYAAFWGTPAFSQSPCSKKCQEEESYRRADETMTIGDWLKSSKLPKSSVAHIGAVVIAGAILFEWDGKSHCKPERADVQQAVAIATLYFQERPQIWHLAAPDGIGAALKAAWPCETTPGQG